MDVQGGYIKARECGDRREDAVRRLLVPQTACVSVGVCAKGGGGVVFLTATCSNHVLVCC